MPTPAAHDRCPRTLEETFTDKGHKVRVHLVEPATATCDEDCAGTAHEVIRMTCPHGEPHWLEIIQVAGEHA